MEPIKAKIIASVAAVSTFVLPPTLYHASRGYIHVYNVAENRIRETSVTALSYVGLQPKRDEASIDSLVRTYARKYNVNEHLVKAMIAQESNANSDSYSPKGAIGLMQIMPGNAKRCGHDKVSKLWDDENNVRCGVQIISEELVTYKGDLYTALRGYNGSPQAVKNNNAATHKYASEVIKKFAQNAYKD